MADPAGLSRRQVLKGSLGAAGALVAGPRLADAGAGRSPVAPRRSAASGPVDPAGDAAAAPPGALGAPVALTADDLGAPLGLSPDDVSFAWRVADNRRGALQSAYRIVVAKLDPTAPAEPGATVWDSGRRRSDHQAFVAYKGSPLAPDSVYSWTVQTWDRSRGLSPTAAPATFETGLRNDDWHASWITRPVDTAVEPDQYTYLRREFTLSPAPIVRGRAYVSADQRYELSVNATRAGKGQAYSYPDTKYYETLDITALLRPGAANAIALLTNWQGATKGHPAGTPGVIAQLSVLQADGTRTVVVTDGNWRVRRGAWLPGTQRDLEGDAVGYTENVNGQAVPLGWDSPGYDDSAWAPATVHGPAGTRPWTNLVSVRTRIVETPMPAVSVTTLASGAVVADFGRVYAAVPTVSFSRGSAGRVVTMRAGYLLDDSSSGHVVVGQPGQVSRTRGTQHTDMSYSYIQRGGSEQFHPFDYLGFRYFQVDDPGEALGPADLVALGRHSAVPDEHAASFSSSNPTIDAVFELGRHSALYTAQEQFVDTPTREKGPWLWDGFNESQTAMAAFGEQNLTHRALLEFAQSQHRYWRNGAVNKIYPTGLGALDINEFTEIYPEWVWRYWLHTGDTALLRFVYPVVSRLSDYVARSIDSSSGLVTRLASTSVYYDYPVVTRLNVLGVNVFRRTADMAVALGLRRREANRHRQRQASLLKALNGALTRGDGTYADGRHADGTQVRSASQEANACALAYGVVPAAKRKTVAAHVASGGLQAPPRTATEVLSALAENGRVDDVVRILSDTTHDGWANIVAQGGTFTWEVWRPSDVNGDSMSHGWGSNVLVSIQRLLLGVRPASPGFASMEIVPALDALDEATGTAPTPRGPVTVSWRRNAGPNGPVDLDVDVPANSRATVHIPVHANSVLTESGQPLLRHGEVRLSARSAAEATIEIGAGSYQFRRHEPGTL